MIYQKQCEQFGSNPKRCLVEGDFSQMISMQIPQALSRERATAKDFSMSILCWRKQLCKYKTKLLSFIHRMIVLGLVYLIVLVSLCFIRWM